MLTIQKRLWISNLMLILITIILLIGVSLLITEKSREFIGFPLMMTRESTLSQ